jgi:hypothetical protein
MHCKGNGWTSCWHACQGQPRACPHWHAWQGQWLASCRPHQHARQDDGSIKLPACAARVTTFELLARAARAMAGKLPTHASMATMGESLLAHVPRAMAGKLPVLLACVARATAGKSQRAQQGQWLASCRHAQQGQWLASCSYFCQHHCWFTCLGVWNERHQKREKK